MSWTCHHCETQNIASAKNCEVCGFPYQKEPDWLCIHCENSNSFGETNCRICGKDYLNFEAIPEGQSGKIQSPVFALTEEWRIPGSVRKREIINLEKKKFNLTKLKDVTLSNLLWLGPVATLGTGIALESLLLTVLGIMSILPGISIAGALEESKERPENAYLPGVPEKIFLKETDEKVWEEPFENPILQMDLSLDSNLLFVKLTDSRITVIDPQTGKRLANFTPEWQNFHLSEGHLVETEFENVRVRILEKSIYSAIKIPFNSKCKNAYFSKLSHMLWVHTKDGGIAFYFLKAKYKPGPDTFIMPHASLETNTEFVCAVFHPRLPVACFATQNGEILLLRYTTEGFSLAKFRVDGKVLAMDLHPELECIAVLLESGECVLTDLKTHKKNLLLSDNNLSAIHFCKNQNALLLGTKGGEIIVFSLENNEAVSRQKCATEPITQIYHFPKIRRLFTGYDKGKLACWRIN